MPIHQMGRRWPKRTAALRAGSADGLDSAKVCELAPDPLSSADFFGDNDFRTCHTTFRLRDETQAAPPLPAGNYLLSSEMRLDGHHSFGVNRSRDLYCRRARSICNRHCPLRRTRSHHDTNSNCVATLNV